MCVHTRWYELVCGQIYVHFRRAEMNWCQISFDLKWHELIRGQNFCWPERKWCQMKWHVVNVSPNELIWFGIWSKFVLTWVEMRSLTWHVVNCVSKWGDMSWLDVKICVDLRGNEVKWSDMWWNMCPNEVIWFGMWSIFVFTWAEMRSHDMNCGEMCVQMRGYELVWGKDLCWPKRNWGHMTWHVVKGVSKWGDTSWFVVKYVTISGDQRWTISRFEVTRAELRWNKVNGGSTCAHICRPVLTRWNTYRSDVIWGKMCFDMSWYESTYVDNM